MTDEEGREEEGKREMTTFRTPYEQERKLQQWESE
jgi:hypothetical protein